MQEIIVETSLIGLVNIFQFQIIKDSYELIILIL